MWSNSIKPTRTKVTFNKTNNNKLPSGFIVHSFCEEKGLLHRFKALKWKKKNSGISARKYFHSRTGKSDVAYAVRIN